MFTPPNPNLDSDSSPSGSPIHTAASKKRNTLLSYSSTLPTPERLSARRVLDFNPPRGNISEETEEAKISVRLMQRYELNTVIAWAKKLKWNPGKLEEFAVYYDAFPNSFWILEKDSVMIGSLAIVPYSKEFAFLGLYIIHENYRGKGYGKILFEKVLEQYQDHTIGLNSVIEQIPNYSKFGFQNQHFNTRWVGKPSRTAFSANITNLTLIEASQVPISNLIDYDKSIFHSARPKFLSLWLQMPNAFTFVAVKDNTIQGYGTISKTDESYKIAPLFANDRTIAEKIIERLYEIIKQHNPVQASQLDIQLDTTDDNMNADSLARQFGLQPSFKTLRMYKGSQPPIDNSKVFGLTSLECG